MQYVSASLKVPQLKPASKSSPEMLLLVLMGLALPTYPFKTLILIKLEWVRSGGGFNTTQSVKVSVGTIWRHNCAAL